MYLTDNYAKINVAAIPFSHRVCWEGCGQGAQEQEAWPVAPYSPTCSGGGSTKGP